MNAIFLDTVGMLALWNEADQWHKSAQEAFDELIASRRTVLTTSFILLECGNAAARRPIRRSVIQWQRVMSANKGLIFPGHDDWSQAWSAYERGEAAQAGIVDQFSFAVMQRLEIRQAFTNDEHFRAAGFETLF